MIPQLTSIVNSFCLQLMNMQASIESREPGQQMPNADEVNAQLRLVTGIEKINRQITLLKKQAAEADTNTAIPAAAVSAMPIPAPVPPAAPVPAAAPAALPHSNPQPTAEPIMARADYEKYKALLQANIGTGNTEMMVYKGHHVELLWLLYNVLEYAAHKEAGDFLPYTTTVRGTPVIARLQDKLRQHQQLAA